MARARRTGLAALDEQVRAFALGLPGAWHDIPWENDVVTKVGKKIFVFHGGPPTDDGFHLGVKLTEELDHALSHPFASPMSYGLGRHGWVSCTFTATDPPPALDVLLDWVEESYRNVATKKLIRELETRAERTAST